MPNKKISAIQLHALNTFNVQFSSVFSFLLRVSCVLFTCYINSSKNQDKSYIKKIIQKKNRRISFKNKEETKKAIRLRTYMHKSTLVHILIPSPLEGRAQEPLFPRMPSTSVFEKCFVLIFFSMPHACGHHLKHQWPS